MKQFFMIGRSILTLTILSLLISSCSSLNKLVSKAESDASRSATSTLDENIRLLKEKLNKTESLLSEFDLEETENVLGAAKRLLQENPDSLELANDVIYLQEKFASDQGDMAGLRMDIIRLKKSIAEKEDELLEFVDEVESDSIKKARKAYRTKDASDVVAEKDAAELQIEITKALTEISPDDPAAVPAETQQVVKTQAQKIQDLNKELDQAGLKQIRFGLSFGYQWLGGTVYDEALYPVDNATYEFSREDVGSVRINAGTNVVWTPLLKDKGINNKITKWQGVNFAKATLWQLLRNLSATATVDLARISGDGQSFDFLEDIEAELGLGWRIGNHIALVFTFGQREIRQLRSGVVTRATTGTLRDEMGNTVTSLDPDDGNLFYDKHFNTKTLRIIWTF